MKISDEKSILDKSFRLAVIQEIESPENINRKQEAKRRYDCYKDFTKFYVADRIKKEMGEETLKIVMNRLSNISICRKITNKKAQVYKDGVVRTAYNTDGTKNEIAQKQIDSLYSLMKINGTMKKTNKWNELQKNSSNYIMPYLCPQSGKYKLKVNALSPFLYDVIEDSINPEMPLVYIFSYFSNEKSNLVSTDDVHTSLTYSESNFRTGNLKDELIADSPDDQGLPQKKFVWWSYNHHFTTDDTGEIIQGLQEENLENKFHLLPTVDFSRYQDGHYWAVGGDDIADGSILFNLLMTDLYYSQMFQGFGYFYAYGKNIPQDFIMSPRKGLVINMEEGDPTPGVGFANSGNSIDSNMKMIEQTLATLLSTNDLEPGTIQGTLSATNAESGIQEIIKRSVNTDDIEDQQQIYKDGEFEQYKVISRIFNYYYDNQLLTPEFMEIGRLDESIKLVIRFPKPQQYLSEKDKLDVIEKRKQIGLDSELDSIMRDNPDYTQEEALDRLGKIRQERAEQNKVQMENILNSKLDQMIEMEKEDESDDQGDDDNGEEGNIQS